MNRNYAYCSRHILLLLFYSKFVISGNSAYGRTLVNKENHTDVTFHQSSDCVVSNLINHKHFHSLNEIGDNIIETENAKANVKLDVPIQIGFFVLEYGKLTLLKFYYDFLLKFVPFEKFCLIEADTDALYIAFSEKNMFLAVYPQKQHTFAQEYDKWFAKDFCDKHKTDFFAAMFAGKEWLKDKCCQTEAKFDSRTVGKFHSEWEGKGVVALCSKCYYCIGSKPKFSSKGVSKVHNDLSEKDYMSVLANQNISTGTNKGFRVKGDSIFTYTQVKKGLNYMYGKRIVGPDHVTTFPTQL